MKIMNSWWNTKFFYLLLVVFSTFTFSCGQRQTDDIRIGILATLSGDSKSAIEVGKHTVNAAKLAAEEFNRAGGLEMGGKKYRITLYIEDDQYNPDKAILATRKLISLNNISALIGPQYSNNAIPVAELTETMRIPMISPMSTNPKTTAGKQYAFRVGFIDPFQGRVLAQFAFNSLKARKAAVLYNIANEYNRGLAEAFKEEFIKYGGKVTAYESYTSDVTDYREQLKHIKAAQPDVLLLPNYTNEIVTQAEQARKMGIKTVMLFGDGSGIASVQNTSLLDGSFQCSHWHPDSTSPESRAFIKAYREVYGEPALDASALTYDALRLLIYAIQSQGKTDSESIRKGLAKIKGYRGVSGIISYQGTGDPLKNVIISRIIDGKKLFYMQVDS